MQLVKKELLELKEQFGDSRKTQIISKTGKNVVKELMQEEESIIISYNTGIIKTIFYCMNLRKTEKNWLLQTASLKVRYGPLTVIFCYSFQIKGIVIIYERVLFL